MKIRKINELTSEMCEKLVALWEDSVRATHDFLTDAEIAKIKVYVPQALQNVHDLLVAEESGAPIAFIGVENGKIEMLFVASSKRGCGVGRQLVAHVVNNYAANTVTVNEQNPQAVGFYKHLGFAVYRRSDTDEQGNPYPLLYMRLSGTL